MTCVAQICQWQRSSFLKNPHFTLLFNFPFYDKKAKLNNKTVVATRWSYNLHFHKQMEPCKKISLRTACYHSKKDNKALPRQFYAKILKAVLLSLKTQSSWKKLNLLKNSKNRFLQQKRADKNAYCIPGRWRFAEILWDFFRMWMSPIKAFLGLNADENAKKWRFRLFLKVFHKNNASKKWRKQ